MSLCGFSSTGFMSTVGGVRQASACSAVERPISPPSAVTAALFDMFCGLNGRTTMPRFVSSRHSPATSNDLPTSEPQPWIISAATAAAPTANASASGQSKRARVEIDLQCPRRGRRLSDDGRRRTKAARAARRHRSPRRRARHAQRARHRSLGPAGVRRGVPGRIAPHHAQSAAAGNDDQQAGEPRGNEIRQVVRARGRPAEHSPARLAMTDQAVGGVQRLVREQARQSADASQNAGATMPSLKLSARLSSAAAATPDVVSCVVSRPTIFDTASRAAAQIVARERPQYVAHVCVETALRQAGGRDQARRCSDSKRQLLRASVWIA